MLGLPRLVWLRMLVNVPSARSETRSVITKLLLRPVERLTVLGPTTEPFWKLPNRPMGARSPVRPRPVVQLVPELQAALPGQAKAALLNQPAAERFVGVVLTPTTRSTFCERPG